MSGTYLEHIHEWLETVNSLLPVSNIKDPTSSKFSFYVEESPSFILALNIKNIYLSTFIGVLNILSSIRKIVYHILWNKEKNELVFFWLKIRNQIPVQITTSKRRFTVNGRKGTMPEQSSQENCSWVKFLFSGDGRVKRVSRAAQDLITLPH